MSQAETDTVRVKSNIHENYEAPFSQLKVINIHTLTLSLLCTSVLTLTLLCSILFDLVV